MALPAPSLERAHRLTADLRVIAKYEPGGGADSTHPIEEDVRQFAAELCCLSDRLRAPTGRRFGWIAQAKAKSQRSDYDRALEGV